jgi:hypothetical protein
MAEQLAPRGPPRHPRLRRAVPAILMILVLGTVAGAVWWKVLRQEGRAAAVGACAAAATVDAHTVKLRVYNASTREGLARTVASQLTRRGFVVLATANDPLLDLRPVTTGWAEVRYGPAGTRQAQLVSAHVPGSRLFRDGRKDAVVDVALGQATRAMAAIQARQQAAQNRQGIVGAAPASAAGMPPRVPGC